MRAMRAWRRWADSWLLFAELPRAGRALAAAWWLLVVARGVLPALFAIATGTLVTAVKRGAGLPLALTVVGTLFITVQVIAPLQGVVSTSLGERLTALLNDRLLAMTVGPSGLGHLEDPGLADDIASARDFELGLTGPPLALALTFIATALTEFFAGLALTVILVAYSWLACLLVATGWLSTHLLLRTTTVWDRETGDVLAARRRADYAYRLAVDPPAAKEIRLFGLSEWVVERFAGARIRLVDARWSAARLPRRRVVLACVLVAAASMVVLLSLARSAAAGAITLGTAVTFIQAAVGASGLALGGGTWALPHAAQAVANVRRLEPRMRERGSLVDGQTSAEGLPRGEIRFREVSFSYSDTSPRVLDRLDLTIPAGSSLAVVGLNGAGKTTLAKLLCRLHDPTAGRIEVDGVDLRELAVDSWRRRLSVIFQDYVRYDLSLRQNVAPLGGSDEEIGEALAQAGIGHVTGLDTVLAAGYPGGTDLSGGQWQRVALARVLHGVHSGAGVVIMDEPTAQLDVRGESEVFERILAATRGRTTVLISHRFAAVRRADRICVLDQGSVAEIGTHDELMAAGGRYKAMFELQASRFGDEESDEQVST